jgi:hypothetical protein
MAAKVLVCDLCRKPTDAIVGKMFYAPTTNGNGGAKSFHNKYQLHLDVGVCCEDKMKRNFKWRQRVSAAVYRRRGKAA